MGSWVRSGSERWQDSDRPKRMKILRGGGLEDVIVDVIVRPCEC